MAVPQPPGKTGQRTASASCQHQPPTVVASSTQSLPSSGYDRKASISSVQCLGSCGPQPSHSFDLQITHRSLLFLWLFPSLSFFLGALRCVQGSTIFHFPPMPLSALICLSRPCESGIPYLFWNFRSFHTRLQRRFRLCYSTETVLRSLMTLFSFKYNVYPQCLVLWPTCVEMPLSWFLNFRNSSALLSYELTVASPELTFIIPITTRWSRQYYRYSCFGN